MGRATFCRWRAPAKYFRVAVFFMCSACKPHFLLQLCEAFDYAKYFRAAVFFMFSASCVLPAGSSSSVNTFYRGNGL